jgi:hypothetical protein
MKQNTSVISVFMHITGKILGESHSCIIILKSSVVTGDLKNILVIIEMDAKMSTDAIILMDGRSLNITQKIISSINAKTGKNALSLTAHIIIRSRIKDNNCKLGSVFFQKPALSLSHRIIICRI